MFTLGDTVSHSRHGIGTIKSIEEKELLGSKAIFVTMYFIREDLKLTVSRKNLEREIREILSEAEGEKILQHLANCEKDLSDNWKTRNRNNQERLTSGDPYELCEVIKGLSALKKKKKGELSNSDRTHLNRALEMLAEELCIALEKTSTEDMMAELREACQLGSAA